MGGIEDSLRRKTQICPSSVLALPLGLLQVVIQEADLAPLDVDFAFLIWARKSDIPHL